MGTVLVQLNHPPSMMIRDLNALEISVLERPFLLCRYYTNKGTDLPGEGRIVPDSPEYK